jgi:hypothetical protein
MRFELFVMISMYTLRSSSVADALSMSIDRSMHVRGLRTSRANKAAFSKLGKIMEEILIDYIIHTSSNIERLLPLSSLKNVGVSPVTFLNWADRCATLL